MGETPKTAVSALARMCADIPEGNVEFALRTVAEVSEVASSGVSPQRLEPHIARDDRSVVGTVEPFRGSLVNTVAPDSLDDNFNSGLFEQDV